MDIQDLIRHYGTQAKAAEAIGYTRQAIHRWKSVGIPMEAQCFYEIKTNGKIKADRAAIKASARAAKGAR
jgi:hypothetical protein